MTESRQLQLDALSEIASAAKLTDGELNSVIDYVVGNKDPFNFYGTPEFDKLYEYFHWEMGEMPYDIAKARVGDPCTWILERLS